MVRTRVIISERFGRIIAQKDRTGVFDRIKTGKRFAYAKLKMLGSDFVCDFNGIFNTVANNGGAVVF